jgi:hypothetical protein
MRKSQEVWKPEIYLESKGHHSPLAAESTEQAATPPTGHDSNLDQNFPSKILHRPPRSNHNKRVKKKLGQ